MNFNNIDEFIGYCEELEIVTETRHHKVKSFPLFI